jgi:hypothetical protein
LGCNYELPETFGLKLLEGRSFTPQTADTSSYTEVIVTEEAVKLMGFKEPIGALFTVGDATCVIIGVVNDFHTESLRNRKTSGCSLHASGILNCSSLFVKYESVQPQTILSKLIQAPLTTNSSRLYHEVFISG